MAATICLTPPAAARPSEQAIYVALDTPTGMANMDCYDELDGRYCADLNKIYVAGYSTGGWVANMWGCYFAGASDVTRKFAPTYHVRAQVSVWCAEPKEQPACTGPVAAFWLHGTPGNSIPIGDEIAALERVGGTNGCSTIFDDPASYASWHAEDPTLARGMCRKYTSCPTDYLRADGSRPCGAATFPGGPRRLGNSRPGITSARRAPWKAASPTRSRRAAARWRRSSYTTWMTAHTHSLRPSRGSPAWVP